jgi:hypothetical protein
MAPTLKQEKRSRRVKPGTQNGGQRAGLAPAHAVGGPATVSGVDFEIDCALFDALELVQAFLSDPLSDGVLRPQVRAGPASALTAWDYGDASFMLVEAKRNAVSADVVEWLTRSTQACHALPGTRCRLVYGEATGTAVEAVDRLVKLTGEVESNERLRELAAHDRIPRADEFLGLMPDDAYSFLRRVELVHREPRTLVETLVARARALFEANSDVVLALSRDLIRNAARDRGQVRASALVSKLRSSRCQPRNLALPIRLDETDAAHVTVFLLSACGRRVPLALLAAVQKTDDRTLQDKLATLVERRIILMRDGVLELSPECPRVAAADGASVLDRLLGHGLAALARGEAWAHRAESVRAIAEMCSGLAPVVPARVATAFLTLDKPLKDVGDVALVRVTADACVDAARAVTPRTEEIRQGEAQALICGVAWAKQRSGQLHEARADAELSLEIGQALGWDRNTAFCHKCLGRLLRLEACALPTANQRDELLHKSISLLRVAINDFTALTELPEAKRRAEVGACYSLLGRTFLELGSHADTLEAIEQARSRIPESPGKDFADLWILRGEFNIRWGTRERARAAFSCAIDAANAPGYEVTEMRARAFEQRARVAALPAEDLTAAADLFRRLKDMESTARIEFEHLRVRGVVPDELVERLAGYSRVVALESACLLNERLKTRGARAAAYRDAIPSAVLDECIESARRRAVIEDGSTARLVTPPPSNVGTKRRRGRQSMLDAARALVPGTRSTYAAAHVLAAELTETLASPPVILEAVAVRLGVKEIRSEPLVTTGELHGDPGNFVISHSAQIPRQRARFTVAHELGHALLLSRGQRIRDGDDLEKFCDEFASALLVPDRFLEAELALPLAVDTVRVIARRFDVSLSAAVRRLRRRYRTFEAFCVRNGAIVWSAGTIPRGPVAALPPDLQRLVEERLATGRCAAEVYASATTHTGMWVVDSVDTSPGGAIFILSPRPRRTPGVA